jgi:hypothetical protein
MRHLFGRAVERLRQESSAAGRQAQFAIFERYDLESPDRDEKITYAQVALEFCVPVTDVTNHLAAMRREFRAIVLEELRTLSATDEEFRTEARHLLGVTAT